MIDKVIVWLFIQAFVYYMEIHEENKSYSKLAAGAALVFFPLTMYQSYKNKKHENKVFREAEVIWWLTSWKKFYH